MPLPNIDPPGAADVARDDWLAGAEARLARGLARVCRLAARTLGVPSVLVTLGGDEARSQVGASWGWDDLQEAAGRFGHSRVQAANGTIVVEDLRREVRGDGLPLVALGRPLCFFAGTPLADPEGGMLGTLVACDVEPRRMGVPERELLEELAAVAAEHVAQFEDARAFVPQALRELHELLDHSLAGFYIVQDDCFVYVNRMLAETCGYAPHEMKGLPVSDVVAEADRDVVATNLRRRFSGEVDAIRYNFSLLRRDGRTVDVEVFGSLSTYNGRPAVVGTLLDVTDRTRYEAQLLVAKERAEEMNRLKSAFLANMSHEIRTPLTSILGFSELLAEELSGDGEEYTQLIRRGGQRLMDTLNSVLDLAQLEAQSRPLDVERVDLAAMAEASLAAFAPQAQARGLSLGFTCRSLQPAVIEVDRAALSRVLNNLVGNAVKFTPEGGVEVVVEADDLFAEVRVEDTGIGIAPDFLAHLFDEFKQESSGIDRDYEGNGLGLAITKRLLDLMGGMIDVESRKGEGSTFVVRFPLA